MTLDNDAPSPQPTSSKSLAIVERSIEVGRKSAKVFGLLRPGGGRAVVLEAGSTFDVALANHPSEPSLIHWYGLTPPWPMAGFTKAFPPPARTGA